MARKEDGTRQKIKIAAMELFSLRGIDGVSVRDIIKEAGAKNSASLHYYFGTKEELVAELVADAAQRSDRARTAHFDALEMQGVELTVEEIVRAVIHVETIGTGDPEQITDPPIGFGHMRFVAAMHMGHRDSFMRAVNSKWDTSYLRYIQMVREALPEIQPAILNQRLIYMSLFMNAALSAREAAFITHPSGGKLWGTAFALENLINVMAAGLRSQ